MEIRTFSTVEFFDDNECFTEKPIIREHFDTREQALAFVAFVEAKLKEMGLNSVSYSVTRHIQHLDLDYIQHSAEQSLQELKQNRIEEGYDLDN